jgi:hypothetical protein
MDMVITTIVVSSMEDQLGEWPPANLDDAAEEVPNELSINAGG